MNSIKNHNWIPLLLLLLFLGNLGFSQEVLQQEITIAFEDISLKESLKKLEETVGISTAYNERELNDTKISVTFEKELLGEVLNALLTNENLSYKVIGNTVTIFRKEKQDIPVKKGKLKKHSISGYFMDAHSKETLLGASVFIPEIKKGTSSNEYGFYSMTLPEGNYEITFSYIGYAPITKQFSLNQDMEFSPNLFLKNELNEVIITADEVTQRHTESQMSSNKLSMEKLKSMPVLMGERDVLKLVQLMPGIQSGSEGSTGLYVRGGGPDQNLLLLDGVPIYNVNHAFGFLSTLNGDAIKSAEIIKGGFPARYGGRLSSILDIRMKEGDMEKFHGDFSIGLVSGKLNLEGPIKKNKTSFNISARRTWLDAFTTPIQKNIKRDDGYKEVFRYFFYDLNFKVNHKFSDKSRLYFSSYLGDDNLNFESEGSSSKENGGMKWGNKIFSARWNYQISPKLFSNTTIYNTSYNFKFSDIYKENLDLSSFSSDSKIRDYGAKVDLNFLPNPNHHIRIGVGYVQHQFTPTVNKSESKVGTEPTKTILSGTTKVIPNEITAYLEDDISIGNKFQLNAGVHFANFNVENSNYYSFQPRVALSYLLNEKSSLKISYSLMTQFLHLLASPGLGWPSDLWVPSTDKINPQNAVQYALGYTRSLNGGLEVTVEGYYKKMDNLLEYKSGFNIFSSSSSWEEKVFVGDGESYGLEFLLEKKTGKFTGWIGYTLSKSDRSFPDIDEGNTFPYKYDRRHDISFAATYKKSDRIDFGLIWVYGTGNSYTLGTRNYNAINAGDEPLLANSFLAKLLPINHIESRNNQKAPAYHRLDLSVNFHKDKKRGKRTWSCGFYNAYSRQNPFVVSVVQKNDGRLILEQQSLLPIIPFVSYSFKF